VSWVAPTTAIAGAIATASLWNSDVRDNALALRATPANRCVAYHDNTQTVVAAATDALNLAAEDVDTATMHDLVTNNPRVVIPSGGGGFYLAIGQSFVDQANNGTVELQLRVTGTAIRRSFAETAGANFEGRTMCVFGMSVMTAAGYFDLAGAATSNSFIFGSTTASLATRLEVIGPLPPT